MPNCASIHQDDYVTSSLLKSLNNSINDERFGLWVVRGCAASQRSAKTLSGDFGGDKVCRKCQVDRTSLIKRTWQKKSSIDNISLTLVIQSTRTRSISAAA